MRRLGPRLVQISTEDGLTLPGLLHESGHERNKVAIYLHGNGSSSIFYECDSRSEYARALMEKGIDFLEFNNRGAEYVKKLFYNDPKKPPKRFGMAYEIIKECIYDIDGCIDFLKQNGYNEFYLMGESTGANKICVYDFYRKNNPISAYILLAGGDDVGIYFDSLGEERFWRLIETAKQKNNEGQGEEIITEMLPTLFSWKGFYDIANPDGDYNVFPFYEVINDKKLSKDQQLFKMFSGIQKPTLCVYGSEDEYAWGDVPRIISMLKDKNSGVDFEIIQEANHEFCGFRDLVGKKATEWLSKSVTQ